MTPLSTAGPTPKATFRFLVVSAVRARMLAGETRAAALDAVAGERQPNERGQLKRVGRRSIERWLKRFNEGGLPALEDEPRLSTKPSAVLADQLCAFLRLEHKADPLASIPELIERARLLSFLASDETVCRTTVWRACRRMGLAVGRRRRLRERDARRFAYAHRMQMVLCDGKHFRAGAERLKRVALFFLDDASRYGLHVVVGTSETSALFLRGFYEMLLLWGLPDTIYLDHGPGFIALDTAAVLGSLERNLVLGTVRYPEGHGKIERFNRTAKSKLLRHLDRRPDVDPACPALELRLRHYLTQVYNHTPHEGLDNKTPAACFDGDERPLSYPESEAKLRERFVVRVSRSVSNVGTISIDGTVYELPRGVIERSVDTERNVLDGSIWLFWDERRVRLYPVDLEANAHARRRGTSKASAKDTDQTTPPPKGAADLAYEQDLGPITDETGGFQDQAPEEDQ
ncbi:MAG: transposase [bacterium]|nr:transposase [bacterium]